VGTAWNPNIDLWSPSETSSNGLNYTIPSSAQWEAMRAEWLKPSDNIASQENGDADEEVVGSPLEEPVIDEHIEKQYLEGQLFRRPIPLSIFVEWLSTRWEEENHQDNFPL
jgi:hypothetical protein